LERVRFESGGRKAKALMPLRASRVFLCCFLLLGSLLLLGVSLEAQLESDLSRILLRLDCSSSLAWEEITLFANGTVRVRDRHGLEDVIAPSDLGQPQDPYRRDARMVLGTLGPDELEIYLERLRGEDLSESEERFDGTVAGDWVDVCRLDVRLPDRPARELTFGRFDSLTLSTSRVVTLTRELAELVELETAGERPFPADYEPRRGDVLERTDGSFFTVVRFTDDGGGVELEGVRQPVTIFVLEGNLSIEFLRLVRRDPNEVLTPLGQDP